MALPELIEIIPLAQPVRAEITVPGSKSITNRALILAALADGEVTLNGALWSEDTQIMVECLKELGFVVHVSPDPQEPCNRSIMVIGEAGLIPPGGTEREPLDLFVGNAGTAARFLAPFLCLGSGVYRLHGVPRMHERPQAALFSALRELGYRVESEFENDKLPARIYGEGPKPGKCRVSIEESSQFASALLLSAQVGNWEIEIVGENADESPYVAMTSKLMEAFPQKGGTFQIEPDASSGSYFWAAGRLVPQFIENSKIGGATLKTTNFNLVSVTKWPISGWQIDEQFNAVLKKASPLDFGLEFARNPLMNHEGEISHCQNRDDSSSPREIARQHWKMNCEAYGSLVISRQHHLGDSIMTAITIAPFSLEAVQFSHLERLRVQECERVVALRTELTKCGAKVIEEGDTLTVYPAKQEELHGAEIETYNDHRMAMCFAILGLKIPGIKIKNPACVKKTFPNFFQKLAAAPPHGLGAEIWEVNKKGKRIRRLDGEDLFAE
jgi:3-phosphoshikimate 1-carboxyvinyltransferase